jgi:hypothetical protein
MKHRFVWRFQNWSVKTEYLWIGAASDRDAHINIIRGGINYRFGG